VYDPMQAGKPFEVRGNWNRWSRYDLMNGVVVPADGAELQEYDPWEAFRANVGKYRTVEQPYTALLELHRHLKNTESENVRFSRRSRGPQNDADHLILEWCNRHGLLGLLPVLSNSIRLPATISSDEHGEPTLEKCHYFRDGGVWLERRFLREPLDAQAIEAEARQLTDERPKPGLTWFEWTSHTYEERALDHVRPFFSATPFSSLGKVRERIQPPCPHFPGFWECYTEPVWEFAYWCEMFALAVDHMSKWEAGGTNVERTLEVVDSYWALDGLAQSVAPRFSFNPERNTLDEERVSAGLLGSYALMFLWDRVERRRALRCQNCHAYFVSDEARARYCTPRCRNTAQSRRYRSKKDASK